MEPYWYPLSVPTISDKEIAAVTDVLRSGHTTMGAKVEEFEARFAERVGARYAIFVNSGSSADLLIALATGGPKGDVLVPAATWPTHVWAWRFAGHRPVLTDVEGINVTPDIIQRSCTPDTVGVSVPHLMGVPARIDEIAESCPTAWVTEDCCEALGAGYKYRPVGKVGHAASWSFFFSHHMTTTEGGMVTTSSGVFANRVRSMRSHGWARGVCPVPGLDPRYTFIEEGFNLRPTEIQAAIGLVQLDRLDEFNRVRARNHRLFVDALAHVEMITFPHVPRYGHACWFGLPMFTDNMPSLRTYLESRGVETRPILGGNLARQPAFAGITSTGTLKGADYLHDHGLYIGLHPVESQVERVANLIKTWAKK